MTPTRRKSSFIYAIIPKSVAKAKNKDMARRRSARLAEMKSRTQDTKKPPVDEGECAAQSKGKNCENEISEVTGEKKEDQKAEEASARKERLKAEKRYLSILKQPVRVERSQKTWRMVEEEDAAKQGRELWEKVLFECRRRREAERKVEAETSRRLALDPSELDGTGDETGDRTQTDQGGGTESSQPTLHFRFLDLPLDIRCMIYELVCHRPIGYKRFSQETLRSRNFSNNTKALRQREDKARITILRDIYTSGMIRSPRVFVLAVWGIRLFCGHTTASVIAARMGQACTIQVGFL
ncbi:uncharacterized protein EI97DRAFT_477446 [Westerdykella ornata]|uniref:Uncharacterized protein n=1 Tax=Westerdykella ornata TaxID=318751 RepID=A0A6A6JTK3_WESOR|nr:uncharacterized protein EI97DRAFT_477446 [Westerdykella ornata]KAF2279941.1 hypothetical protein EI97DRAFT_477446 [Westerdykella ornata]